MFLTMFLFFMKIFICAIYIYIGYAKKIKICESYYRFFHIFAPHSPRMQNLNL